VESSRSQYPFVGSVIMGRVPEGNLGITKVDVVECIVATSH
jgi:hypothetical protein